MGHALIVEGASWQARMALEDKFEQWGHDLRAKTDARYKRRTWGLRPEDIAGQRAVVADMTGVRR